MTNAEATANRVTGVFVYADDQPDEVTLDMAMEVLKEARLTPEQWAEGWLYMASQLAERI